MKKPKPKQKNHPPCQKKNSQGVTEEVCVQLWWQAQLVLNLARHTKYLFSNEKPNKNSMQNYQLTGCPSSQGCAGKKSFALGSSLLSVLQACEASSESLLLLSSIFPGAIGKIFVCRKWVIVYICVVKVTIFPQKIMNNCSTGYINIDCRRQQRVRAIGFEKQPKIVNTSTLCRCPSFRVDVGLKL